jgi:hypothetical protein
MPGVDRFQAGNCWEDAGDKGDLYENSMGCTGKQGKKHPMT